MITEDEELEAMREHTAKLLEQLEADIREQLAKLREQSDEDNEGVNY